MRERTHTVDTKKDRKQETARQKAACYLRSIKECQQRADTVNMKVELTTDSRASKYAATHQFGNKRYRKASRYHEV